MTNNVIKENSFTAPCPILRKVQSVLMLILCRPINAATIARRIVCIQISARRVLALRGQLVPRCYVPRPSRWLAAEDVESRQPWVLSSTSTSTGTRPPSAVRRPPSAVRRPPSAVRRPPSAVRRPPSAVRRPPSAVRRPPSAVRRPPSAVPGMHVHWETTSTSVGSIL